MNADSKVSVVIPCFNAAPYLGQAIDSVLDQTYSDVEVVVVDDGSTDESALVAKRYGSQITFIRQDNAGASAARNTAIKAATGELIAFLDADDYWLPHKLERQVPAFCDPRVGLVHAYHLWVNTDGSPKNEVRFGTAGQVFHSLLEHCTVGTLTVIMRREIIDLTGLFDTTLRAGTEDWDMWLRASLHCEVAVVPEILSCYRLHQNSLTSQNHFKIAKELFRVLNKHSQQHENCLQCRNSVVLGRQHIRDVYSARILYGELDRSREGQKSSRFVVPSVILNPKLLFSVNFYKLAVKILINRASARIGFSGK